MATIVLNVQNCDTLWPLCNYAGYVNENPMVHNCFNIDEERLLQRCNQSCDDGNRYSVKPISDLSQNFPKPPPDLDQNLKQHLLDLKEAVFNGLESHNCSLSGERRKRATDRYHRQIISHLHILLQNITLSKNTIMLMNWVLHTYLRYVSVSSCMFAYYVMHSFPFWYEPGQVKINGK